MGTKKSLCFLVGLFVIMVWIWGFATPVLSETLKCKGEGKQVNRSQDNFEGSIFIGVTAGEGTISCDNGETLTSKTFSLWDANWQVDCFTQTYTVLKFKDFSKIFIKYKYTQLPDPKNEVEWIWDGTGEIVRGTGQFYGIKGTSTLKGKQLYPDKNSVSEITITYTLK